MVPARPTADEQSTETTLPSACMVCGGDLDLRVTGSQATSYCRTCHWVARPEVTFTFNGLKVQFKHVGKA